MRVLQRCCAVLAVLVSSLGLPAAAEAVPALVRTIGSYGTGDGQFGAVGGLGTDRAGNLYATDANDRVEVFGAGGTFLRAWGSAGAATGRFSNPTGIAVDAHGAVYVADTGNNRIQVFDTSGTFLRTWGTSGTADGQFSGPRAVAIAPDGDVFVRDASPGRVQEFTPAGAFVQKFSVPAFQGRPVGLAIDQAGSLYLTDRDSARIAKVTATGAPLTTFGSAGTGDGQFSAGPVGVAVGSGNLIYGADDTSDTLALENRVEQFGASGGYLGKFDEVDETQRSSTFTSVAADCAGNVYVGRNAYPSSMFPAPVAQVDAYHDATAPQSCGLVVDDAGDAPDVAPGDQTCADADGTCTLRAAIQEANAEGSSSVAAITFAIPGGGAPRITPGSALPAVTVPVDLDATTQPGTGRERVLLGSDTAPLAFGGLDLQGAGSKVEGLRVSGFGGVGLKLEGPGGDRVTQSIVSADDIGIEVDSPGAVLDGLGVAANGSPAGAKAFGASLAGRSETPAEAQPQLLGLGGGIVVRSGGSGLVVKGSVIGGLRAEDGASPGALTQATGILLAPGAAPLNGITIGDAAAPNVFRANSFGVVAAAPSGAVGSLVVAGNSFGAEPSGGAPLAPFSNGVGVLLSGNVTSPAIGLPRDKNTFVDSPVAIEALGSGIERLRVQFNLVGADQGLGDLVASLSHGAALGSHNLFGLILGDVHGATVGGGAGSGNAFLGDGYGVLMSGKRSTGNVVDGNNFGRYAAPSGKVNVRPIGVYGSLVGIVASDGASNKIGEAGLGNDVDDTVMGILISGESSDIAAGNTIKGNLYGLALNDAEGASVGNASAGSGNTIEENWIGALQAHRELTGAEETATKLTKAPADAADRSAPLASSAAAGPLGIADALTSADVGAKAVTLADQPGALTGVSARYGRNVIGGSGSSTKHGNYLGMVFAGDVRHTIVGVGGGGPNLIEHNHLAGVAMTGVGTHVPQGVSLLGNAIYDNSRSADSLFPGARGLGIDLTTASGGDAVFGPTPNDPGDADAGPNGLQNFPLLTHVSRSPGGRLTYDAVLESTPGRRFQVEIDSSPRCNPHGYGEGLHVLKTKDLETSESGSAVGEEETALRFDGHKPVAFGSTRTVPAGDHYLTATATAADGSTSEYSPCVKISAAAKAPALSLLPSDSAVSGSGDTSVEVFNAGAYGVTEVTLDRESTSTQHRRALAATARTAKKKTKKASARLALTRVHIRPHHARSVRLRLTAAARKLLAKRRKLAVVATVISGKGRRRHTARVRYTISAPAKRRTRK